jgi:hypothetical protein
MKKLYLFFIPLMCLLLASCVDPKSLYEGDAFNTDTFAGNYYEDANAGYKVWNEKLSQSNLADPVVYDVSEEERINSYNDIQFADKMDDQGNILDYELDTPHIDNGVGYGPTKNLTTIDDSFADGFLSRLYDGRLKCDGYYANSRVQLKESGYATLFSKELTSYNYFAMSFRGGTDYDHSGNETHYSQLDVTITFYVYDSSNDLYTPYVFNLLDMDDVFTDSGGSNVVLKGFYFDTVLGENADILKRTSAMSITYHVDSCYAWDLGNEEANFAMMLYEILLPGSTWY